MLQNFVSNALRYTAQGRVIVGVLGSGNQPERLRVGVWDTGPGIAPEQQAQLFAEFQRAGHTSPWGEQGIGLGLAIVERMAKRLNHPIRFHSHVGYGSCFMLELPIAPPRQHSISITAPTQNALTRLKVLCLDNDATILQGMQVLLDKWGCHLLIAQTPEQARQILASETIQVLLVDQHLDADIEGLDFLLQYNTRHIPAALITADSNPALPQIVKQHGIGLLKKPLKPAALRAFLAGVSA
jgi:CheY-like chemotaxis protein